MSVRLEFDGRLGERRLTNFLDSTRSAFRFRGERRRSGLKPNLSPPQGKSRR
jgi:hypothetical protein